MIGSLRVVGLVVVLGLAITGFFTQSHSTPSIGERTGSSWVMVQGSVLEYSYVDWRSGNGTYVLIVDDAASAGHWTNGHIPQTHRILSEREGRTSKTATPT